MWSDIYVRSCGIFYYGSEELSSPTQYFGSVFFIAFVTFCIQNVTPVVVDLLQGITSQPTQFQTCEEVLNVDASEASINFVVAEGIGINPEIVPFCRSSWFGCVFTMIDKIVNMGLNLLQGRCFVFILSSMLPAQVYCESSNVLQTVSLPWKDRL